MIYALCTQPKVINVPLMRTVMTLLFIVCVMKPFYGRIYKKFPIVGNSSLW